MIINLFKDGKPHDSVEYRNAWGAAAFVWNALFEKYLKDPNIPFDSWLVRGMKDDSQELWDLADREDLPMFERAVHASTFDYAIIRNNHFKQFAKDLRQFVAAYPAGESVCHLSEWAKFIESCDAEAIGFYGTSVSDNLWFEWDEEREDSTPYDLNIGTKHFEIYDELHCTKEK